MASSGILHREGPIHHLVLAAVLARDEHVLARELLEQGRRLAEVRGQHVAAVPVRKSRRWKFDMESPC